MSSCTFVVLHWRGQLRRVVLMPYVFAKSVLTLELLITIMVVSKRHRGCANGGCPKVVVDVVTACPDLLLSRWDGLAEGGRRAMLAYLRERRWQSAAGLGRHKRS